MVTTQNNLEICGGTSQGHTIFTQIMHLHRDNDVFYDQIIVSVVFDSILLRQDQLQKKGPASTVADNNLTLIYPEKAHGACSPVWTRSSQSKLFGWIKVFR